MHSSPPSTRPLASPRSLWRTAAGMSLVELVMAIGIIGFAMVPLMGLMPAGLNLMRDSADGFALSLIRRDLAAECRSIGYSELMAKTPGGMEFFFGANGERVEASSPLRIYRVQLQANTATGVDGSVAADGARKARLSFSVERNGRPSGVITLGVPDDGN